MKTTFPVEGMTCAACQSFVERTLTKQPGVKAANVNLLLHQATVDYEAGETTLEALVAAVTDTGYPARMPDLLGGAVEEQRALERDLEIEYRSLLRRTALALILAVSLTAASMPLMGGHSHLPWLHVILFGLTLVAMAGPGRHFYRKAWASLRHGAMDMYTLVALGTGSAFVISAAGSFAPEWFARQGLAPALYYEAVGWILGFVLLGNTLEARAKRKTTRAIEQLVELQPAGASELKVGDVVQVRPGERIAADGMVLDGASSVDESMWSGESLPVEKAAGAALIGGSLNLEGALRFRVTAVGESTTLARIVRLLREAQSSRAPLQRLADRVSAVFVPAVLGIAAITTLAWWFFSPEHNALRALAIGITVLVIACPCAMGLSVPTAAMVASGRAAQAGILIKGGEALERLSQVDTIVLDKTGTLTAGRPRVVSVHPAPSAWSEERILRYAAALERNSEHPLAQAVLMRAEGLAIPEAEGFRAVPGRGVEGRIEGHSVFLGRASEAFLAKGSDEAVAGLPEEATHLYLRVDEKTVGAIAVADVLKPSSPKAVEEMLAMGLRVFMLTGDREGVARAIAAQTGLREFRAGMLPEDKAAAIQEEIASGSHVAMVGDGMNDAPALAASSVGIVMGSGSGVALEAGDVTLLRNDLLAVPQAIVLARATMNVMRQNLFWAFLYNAIGIPVAAMGYLNPVLASAAMAFSSVSVVLNSLRLWRVRLDGR